MDKTKGKIRLRNGLRLLRCDDGKLLDQYGRVFEEIVTPEGKPDIKYTGELRPAGH